MLGIDVKRGVATTTERVFNASGDQFGSLEILWTGKTAGIIFDRIYSRVNAKILFPSIDEKSNIPQATFNNLIGYSLHELGHAWYTDNAPWDKARAKHGSFVGSLINGLEDPRIERLVIESGRAPNARVLFENLINSILARDGYVDPLDKRNIPFVLAVEGRRLNGYSIGVDSIVSKSPWAKHIKWALKRAQSARDTATIAKIAIELFSRIKEQEQEEKQKEKEKEQGQGQPDKPQGGDGEPSDGNPSDDANDAGEGEGEANGQSPSTDDSDESQGGSENGQGDKPSDSQDGQPSDEQGNGQGQPQDGEGDGQGGGKSDTSFDGGRDVEPSDFIQDELSNHSSKADEGKSRPSVGKPVYATFHWG
jgi:hypothetical protein